MSFPRFIMSFPHFIVSFPRKRESIFSVIASFDLSKRGNLIYLCHCETNIVSRGNLILPNYIITNLSHEFLFSFSILYTQYSILNTVLLYCFITLFLIILYNLLKILLFLKKNEKYLIYLLPGGLFPNFYSGTFNYVIL
jgi:hypothetical protein